MATLAKNLRNVDTLPEASGDFFMPYEGLHGLNDSGCRVRLYEKHLPPFPLLPRPSSLVVIVLTDSDHGTSVTNRIERACWLAWQKVGRPWPVVFVEHYMGWQRPATGVPKADREHVCRVFFNGTSGDGPIEVPFRLAEVLGPPFTFLGPRWRHLELDDFRAFLEGSTNVEAIGGDLGR